MDYQIIRALSEALQRGETIGGAQLARTAALRWWQELPAWDRQQLGWDDEHASEQSLLFAEKRLEVIKTWDKAACLRSKEEMLSAQCLDGLN